MLLVTYIKIEKLREANVYEKLNSNVIVRPQYILLQYYRVLNKKRLYSQKLQPL